MPDWFYRTVSRPVLFRFSAPRARDFALGFMGGLSRLPFGPYLIDFLGHMRADSRLRRSFVDTDFPTAVGIGPWLDNHAVAVKALARFGVGFIEVGPVSWNRTSRRVRSNGSTIARLFGSTTIRTAFHSTSVTAGWATFRGLQRPSSCV